MFEKYTEKARRVIFFARYEASQFGSQAIETEHILLGLLREDKELISCVFGDPRSATEAIRKDIETVIKRDAIVSASVDLPLAQSVKRVLSLAADESQQLGHRHIGTEHLLLGLIKEADSLAGKILKERAISEEKVLRCIEGKGVPTESYEIRGSVGRASFSQIDPLISILAERGVITREEFYEAFAKRYSPVALKAAFDSLLDLLLSKGVINEEERRKLSE